MSRRTLLLKISFVVMLLIAALHTFFVVIGGPPLPATPEFLKMQELMRSIQVDSGAGIMHTTQDFMDGFNIIVSIFLITLPVLGWSLLTEVKDNEGAVRKLTVVILLAEFSFFLTSLTLLAIGGTILSGIASALLLGSLLVRK
jgi:hypothetical protein